MCARVVCTASPGERGKEEEAAAGVEKTGAPRRTDEKESVGRESPCTYDVCTKSRLAKTHICNFLYVCKIIKSGNISTPMDASSAYWSSMVDRRLAHPVQASYVDAPWHDLQN